MVENDADTVEIDRETLETLRAFTDAHLAEYGWPAHHHAVIDSGNALGLDDPTPTMEFRRIDVEGLREICGDGTVDRLREQWERYADTSSSR